ncbi:eCIS core domain-containing protein [Cellulomonas sp. URHB0016]
MHSHDHQEQAESGLRPKASRVDEERTAPTVARALADRRPDMLGAAGVTFLQRTAGNASTAGLVEEERSPVLDVLSSGGGRALDPETRTDMESRLGADFGDVRVHSDSAASDSAKAVGAHAYTVGSDVVLGSGVDTSSTSGRTTLAHELTHVVQQRSGPVDGSPAGGGIQVSDPGDRFERAAQANAERVMAGPAPTQRATAEAGPAVAAPSVQREELDGEGAGGAPVQREGEEKEEEAEA